MARNVSVKSAEAQRIFPVTYRSVWDTARAIGIDDLQVVTRVARRLQGFNTTFEQLACVLRREATP